MKITLITTLQIENTITNYKQIVQETLDYCKHFDIWVNKTLNTCLWKVIFPWLFFPTI